MGRWSGQMAPEEGRRRVHRKAVWALLAAPLVSQVLLSHPGASYVPLARSLLRQLMLPAAGQAMGGLLPFAARAQESGQEGLIRIGGPFQVSYPGAIPGDDFYLGGGGAEFGTGLLDNPKVVFVKPGSRAYGMGLRIGDELVLAWKEGSSTIFSEGELRRMENVDQALKEAANSTMYFGQPAPQGLSMQFTARGVAQPGDPAPDFKLAASTGGELTLAELLKGNEYLVVFFRPGSRFRGGDLQEVRLFGKATRALAERGATVVGIQIEPKEALARQAQSLQLDFPLLCDDGSVARAYGTYLELEEQGPNIDRKTFIIGKDGTIKATFVDIGYDADKKKLANHVADVVRVLGGDPVQAKEDMKTKSKSVGEMLDIAIGKQAPSPRM
ncbi:unnamed protein product [Durusdinium trenchii]